MDAKHQRYPSNLDKIATADEQSVCALSKASPCNSGDTSEPELIHKRPIIILALEMAQRNDSYSEAEISIFFIVNNPL
ncbi:MAG: hypothetical protein PHV54_00815 [Tolumonas sp.]|nr:hypothetical protein [Tolumonas sp.]